MSFEERFLSDFTLRKLRHSYLYSRTHDRIGERQIVQTEYTESILSDIVIIRPFTVLKTIDNEVYHESFTIDFIGSNSPLSFPDPLTTRGTTPPRRRTRLSQEQRQRQRASVEHSSRSSSVRLRYPSLRPTANSPAPSPTPSSPIHHSTPIDYSRGPEYVDVIDLTHSDPEEN